VVVEDMTGRWPSGERAPAAFKKGTTDPDATLLPPRLPQEPVSPSNAALV